MLVRDPAPKLQVTKVLSSIPMAVACTLVSLAVPGAGRRAPLRLYMVPF